MILCYQYGALPPNSSPEEINKTIALRQNLAILPYFIKRKKTTGLFGHLVFSVLPAVLSAFGKKSNNEQPNYEGMRAYFQSQAVAYLAETGALQPNQKVEFLDKPKYKKLPQQTFRSILPHKYRYLPNVSDSQQQKMGYFAKQDGYAVFLL